MKLVIFGLSMSSSWGNGHATLWRGLIDALHRRHCAVTFFERDVPYYSDSRDISGIDYGDLVIYSDWDTVLAQAKQEIAEADAILVTSYCPDAVAAARLAEDARGLLVFYDLDTPVTLDAISSGRNVDYIGPQGLTQFDLVLSYTGGKTLDELRRELGARRVAPLYGHVDPKQYRPVPAMYQYRSHLSYLGTYAHDRQAALTELFLKPAAARTDLRFLIGGAQYPDNFPWLANLYFVRHLPPTEHPAFFASSRLTLNVTRMAMARSGWCPSGRLFEAAACGTAILSDAWEGISAFYEPGREVLLVRNEQDVLEALDATDQQLARIGEAARERTLAAHTSDHRADELLRILWEAPLERQAFAESA
ncbi:CgeB family protein [Hyphomicrobium sp.]|uniref:CgeB family protein n=1 Tax=Hyphomicrobium sp. TaxID=82 RepID=UPI002D770A43|nr:glycosyltransferase [Hyphomicrobium sp.]HET6390376.1 glycosyltransferase [Hyphomicrobium sp.]